MPNKALQEEMSMLSTHCLVTSVPNAIHQLFTYLLAIIVLVYKFLTPKLYLAFGSFIEQSILSHAVVIYVTRFAKGVFHTHPI